MENEVSRINLKLEDKERCEIYKKALIDISRHLDNLEYECRASVYSLDDDEMSWIFYCRDLADQTIKKCDV